MTYRKSRRTFLKESVVGVTGVAVAGRLQAGPRPNSQWATLRGRIVYDGTPPEPKRIRVTKDVDVCGKYDLIDETLVVDRKSHGVRDVVVSLKPERGESITAHDDYKKDETEEVMLDNNCCRFAPHVTVLRTTQTLVIRNLDPKGDTVVINSYSNTPINITLTQDQTYKKTYPVAERRPVQVSCAIHPWERGWLVVSDHPYVAVTDKEGKFEIRNVPVGKHSFMFWQEAGYVDEVTVGGQPQNWRRGTPEFDLVPGDNDLGDILVKPAVFEL